MFLHLAALLMFAAHAEPATPAHVKVCFHKFHEEPVTAAILLAKKNGYFRDENLEIEIAKWPAAAKQETADAVAATNFDSTEENPYFRHAVQGINIVKSTQRGLCDFSSVTTESLLVSKVNVEDVKLQAVYLYGKKYDTSLLVRNGSQAKSVQDLKGKTVRVGQIGTRILLEKILNSNGMVLSDVIMKRVPLKNLPQALQSGEVEAVIAYNPTTPLLLASKSARILEGQIFSRYLPPYVPHSSLIANSNFVKSESAAAEKFMRAFRRAAEYLKANPKSLVTALSNTAQREGSGLEYEGFSAVTIQKSNSLIQIADPYYIGDKSSGYNHEEVYNSALAFQKALTKVGFLKTSDDARVARLLR